MSDLLHPVLPHDLRPRARAAIADAPRQAAVDHATRSRLERRERAWAEAFGPRLDAVRAEAGAIRRFALEHLGPLLAAFIDRAEAAGIRVHCAADAAEAREIVLRIAQDAGCTACVKSKSMVTEEIALAPALERAGIDVLETDLGEFVVQLDDDAPAHIVTPILHKSRRDVGRSFERELGVPYCDDPEQLTRIARAHMRERYRRADLGVTGANFLLAETGSIVLCTNEGNADLALSLPRVHVAVAGIEKVVAGVEHLAVLLKLLARSGTGQPLTVYTSFVNGPRRGGEPEGPEEVHLVLLDGGRSAIRGGAAREILHCIRCGACLNACPAFRAVGGGHAYGAVYSGPIGAVLTPRLAGLASYPDLPRVCSLCEACGPACPVDIDLPREILRIRAEQAAAGLTPRASARLLRAWRFAIRRPRRYALLLGQLPRILRLLGRRRGGSIVRLHGPLAPWTAHRDLPPPAAHPFRAWWREREGGRR